MNIGIIIRMVGRRRYNAKSRKKIDKYIKEHVVPAVLGMPCRPFNCARALF